MCDKKKQKKVISAGHICLDITPEFKCSTAEKEGLDNIFVPGRLLKMGKAKVSLGGSVANTGIGIKLMGGNVELMTSIGDDEFAELALRQMKLYGVDTDSILRSKEICTAYSVILAPPGIDRIILHYEGTNAYFDLGDIDIEKISGADLFHFGYPSLMRSMYKNTGENFIELLKAVRDAGTAISVDMAMFEEDSDAGQEDWNEILRQVLPLIDFFMPSAEELCIMLDKKRYHEWNRRAGGRDVTEILDIEKDICPLADRLFSYGAKAVLIKCGVRGIYFRTAGREKLEQIQGSIGKEISESWADKEYFEKSYRVEKVVSGTGAGDSAIAGFITALLAGESWQDCLKIAAAAGAICVGGYDALSVVQPLSEMKKKIYSDWGKN